MSTRIRGHPLERETLQEKLRALQEALAAEPDQPPVDSMLDVYNTLAAAVRGGEGEGIRDLNDRLRGVFQEFGLDEVATGVICIVPILRDDVIERYGDSMPVMIGPDGMKPLLADVPDAVPLVLFAGDQPPAVEGNEPNTQESWHLNSGDFRFRC